MKEYPVDPERIRLMEQTARDIAAALGRATAQNNKKFAGEKWGFALFLFSFGERGEMTYVSNADREDLYGRFRTGALRRLVLSKVGNFAIDLPDASVLIQVSGTFGSRQEEAQRLGRILRPKSGGETAHFYTLVTRDTRELDFAHHRQLFLTEQGYSYRIADGAEMTALRTPLAG